MFGEILLTISISLTFAVLINSSSGCALIYEQVSKFTSDVFLNNYNTTNIATKSLRVQTELSSVKYGKFHGNSQLSTLEYSLDALIIWISNHYHLMYYRLI